MKLWAFGGAGHDNIYGGHLADRLYRGTNWDTIYCRGGLSDSALLE